MKDALTIAETRAMFCFVAQKMIDSQDRLTAADRAIGDGDHGVGMTRGFEAVLAALQDEDSPDLKCLFNRIGMALLTSVGGAAGVIFGTWFTGSGKGLAGKTSFDREGLVLFLQDGCRAVQARGKAKAGDKTMLDALLPAGLAAEESGQASLAVVLARAVRAAQAGVIATQGMVATVGKAKALGERSLGYADPGALSTSLILEYIDAYIHEN